MKDIGRLTNDKGIITALAIDQRGALRRMMGEDIKDEDIESFKIIVSGNLTAHASSILLDPEYGLPAAKVRDESCGVLLAYEKTGYDKTEPGRRPDLLNQCSVRGLKEAGADAVKLLVYIDVDEADAVNDEKKAFISRVGSECKGEDIPYFLEILTYDAEISDDKGREYAAVKPGKVIGAMKEYAKPEYHVDVLKVEVPVNMKYVEGFGVDGDAVYSKEEAAEFFKAQSTAGDVPFIFLSAGVETGLFIDTLKFAAESGSSFNGILGGRAIWKDAASVFLNEGKEAAKKWVETKGVENIREVMSVVEQTASPADRSGR